MQEIVLIDTGNFQSYIIDNIHNLQKFGLLITIICDKEFMENFILFKDINLVDSSILDIENFNKNNKLDNTFRSGFWTLASKRLFYLYSYMKQFNKENIFHIENDVMIYHNLENLIPDQTKIWLTMDNINRCIPGIIFIPNYKLLALLISNYNYSLNDMENMALFYWKNKNICDTFPIIIKNKDYSCNDIYTENNSKFEGIFDAAAIGQYLGGVDPRNIPGNTKGFINETCVVNYSKYKFIWKLINNLKIPFIQIENKDYPIYNLHIHSKNLKEFMC
jgi:hypothetical protein